MVVASRRRCSAQDDKVFNVKPASGSYFKLHRYQTTGIAAVIAITSLV
jgi:hypothetical protein